MATAFESPVRRQATRKKTRRDNQTRSRTRGASPAAHQRHGCSPAAAGATAADEQPQPARTSSAAARAYDLYAHVGATPRTGGVMRYFLAYDVASLA